MKTAADILPTISACAPKARKRGACNASNSSKKSKTAYPSESPNVSFKRPIFVNVRPNSMARASFDSDKYAKCSLGTQSKWIFALGAANRFLGNEFFGNGIKNKKAVNNPSEHHGRIFLCAEFYRRGKAASSHCSSVRKFVTLSLFKYGSTAQTQRKDRAEYYEQCDDDGTPLIFGGF